MNFSIRKKILIKYVKRLILKNRNENWIFKKTVE